MINGVERGTPEPVIASAVETPLDAIIFKN